MQADPEDVGLRRARRTLLWLGCGVILVVTVGVAWIGRHEPVTADSARAMAGIVALGTFAIGWLGARATTYPRWAWISSAALIGSLIFGSTFWTDPLIWEREVRTSVWMLPWLLMVFGSSSNRKSGACAPSHPRSGWIMIGVSLLVTSIVLEAHVVADWVRRF